MPNPDLHQGNLRFLRARFPDVAAALTDLGPPTTAIVRDGGEAVDIDIGGARFYGAPVDDFIGEQLAAFRGRPERYHFNPPNADLLDSETDRRMVRALRRHIGNRDLPDLPVTGPGFLVVIGVGLGRHIPKLVAEVGARHVVIVEPFAEFLRHSLDVVDWEAIAAACPDLRFVLEDVADAALDRLVEIVHDIGAPFIDGGTVYLHYRTSTTEAIRDGLRDRITLATLMLGYIEDEELMIANAAANFRDHAFRLIDGDRRPRRSEPVFIVGAGPSLTEDLDAIARWRDRAIVFSSGTALQTLLGRGVVPDYHVEVENHAIIVDKIPAMAKAHGRLAADGTIPDITLIAAETIQPGVLRFFADTYLFLREDLSATQLFGGDFHPVAGSGPLVANTALAVAAALGFSEVYLFGTDCGVRDPEHRHAEDTVYSTDATFAALPDYVVDRKAAANFGGTVWADFLLTWSRLILEKTIDRYGLDAVNCSDGARIAGAESRRAESLAFTGPPLDRETVRESIRAGSRFFAPGTFVDATDLERRRSNWDRLAAGLTTAIEAGDRNPESLYRRVAAFFDTVDDAFFTATVRGTATNLIQIGAYFTARIDDPDDVSAAFAEIYAGLMAEVLERGRRGLDLA